jgi:hypothetical protein
MAPRLAWKAKPVFVLEDQHPWFVKNLTGLTVEKALQRIKQFDCPAKGVRLYLFESDARVRLNYLYMGLRVFIDLTPEMEAAKDSGAPYDRNKATIVRIYERFG